MPNWNKKESTGIYTTAIYTCLHSPCTFYCRNFAWGVIEMGNRYAYIYGRVLSVRDTYVDIGQRHWDSQ